MAQYCDKFKILPDPGENFKTWQGLRGPYYVPDVDQDGWLHWTNNGGLPNPEPVKIVGADGRGIQLAGYAASVADLPESAENGDCWAVGEEDPLEAYAWFDGWQDLGVIFPPGPAGQDGQDGQDGQGVPTGGSAGQYLKKVSATDYDTEWSNLDAEAVEYDDTETYSSGTVGEELSTQKNTSNQLETEIDTISNAIGVVVDGNKSAVSASYKQYVILQNSTIAGKSDGLYTAAKTIPANTVIDGTYLTAVSRGGLNSLIPLVTQETYLSSINVDNGVFKTFATFVPPVDGLYIFIVTAGFGTGTAGSRIIIVDTTETSTNTEVNSVAVTGRATIQKTRIFGLTTSNRVYIRGYQNSGGALSAFCSYRCVIFPHYQTA